MATHDPSFPSVLTRRWEEGPHDGNLAQERKKQQQIILNAIQRGREELDIGPLERNAKKLELQSFLASPDFNAYLEECRLIASWLPSFKTSIPPYEAFPNVQFRETQAAQREQNRSNALGAREAAAVQILGSGCKKYPQNDECSTPQISNTISHTKKGRSGFGSRQESWHRAQLSTPFRVGLKTKPGGLGSTPAIPKKVNNPVMAAAPTPRPKTSANSTPDVRLWTPQNLQHRSTNSVMATPPIDGRMSKSCTCSKSACLKLYCGCFASSTFCDFTCKCQGCKNTPTNPIARDAAVSRTLNRCPEAFIPKESRNFACTCKRSRCLKMYCDCFAASVTCGDRCRCLSCQNFEGSILLRNSRSHQGSVSEVKAVAPETSPVSILKKTSNEVQHSQTDENLLPSEWNVAKKRKSPTWTPRLSFPIKRSFPKS